MAKIDLEDAYLTIPVAQDCLLSFKVHPGQWMEFHYLAFGLCTAPFVFSKVTKPIVQFLRVQLIIYLDDLLLAAPNKSQLIKNLSTTLVVYCPGLHDQFPQEHNLSNSTDRVLGFCHKHSDDDHHPSTLQDGSHTEGSLLPPRSWISPNKDFC